MDGVIHDFVVHKKKKIKGKWVKPTYVHLFRHELPDGETVVTQGGTQIIDRIWGSLRKHMGTRAVSSGVALTAARVRSAQWCIWHSRADWWLKTRKRWPSR